MTLSRSNQQRALVALVEVLGLAVWFSATAVAPTLRSEWGIGATGAVWLTASVQIGFVTGAITSAVFNLADRVTPQKLLAASALGAAACTAAIAFFATGLGSAVPMRFLTGMFLAGVYPVGMKLMASWSESADRGRAFGILIGALTLGSALPHLISGFGPLPWRSAMLAAAILSTTAAVVALAMIRPGPHLDIRPGAPDPRHALALFAERGSRLVSLGYFGHMWELYALWTWLSTFIVAGREARGDTTTASTGFIAFGAIGVAGAAGSLLGGWASDRFGRPPAAVAALAISGSCCVASPLFFAAPAVVLVAFVLVWGAAVIADSGVFSTALSETTDARYVGTALTAQTGIGFLLTVVTIQLVPIAAELIGWHYALLILAPGPLIGAVAMSTLNVPKQHPHPQEESHDQQPHAHNAVRRSDSATLTHCR
ncbi:MAG TPA: MFS transporter [Mycobacterium sp.]|nr:MFS transporter [Mycobacterium sp.]